MRKIWDNHSGGSKTYAVVFDNDAWLQERLICAFYGQDERRQLRIWSNLEGSYAAPIATYTLDASNNAQVDLTDYIRTYYSAIGDTGTIYMSQVTDDEGEPMYGLITIPFIIAGFISPKSVFIPPHDMLNGGGLIMPPDMLLSDRDTLMVVELYKTIGTWSVEDGATLSPDGRQIAFDGYFTITDGTKEKTYNVRSLRCGVEYSRVRWLSFTGVTREAWWEVVKHTTETSETLALSVLGTGYDERKGRVDGLTLRLTDLNAYDLWYYSDIITSARVEIYNSALAVWQRVQVTDKSITLPDGDSGTDGKLNVKLNFAHYDAVVL